MALGCTPSASLALSESALGSTVIEAADETSGNLTAGRSMGHSIEAMALENGFDAGLFRFVGRSVPQFAFAFLSSQLANN